MGSAGKNHSVEQIREQVLRPLQKHNRKCCQTFSDGTRFVDHSKRLGFSGRELVEQIIENPYLQYFIGLPKYQETASFDPSALVSFRKRIDLDMAVFLNDSILADTSAELPERKRLSKKHDRGRNDKGNPSGGGKPAEAKQPEDQKTETASPSNTGDKKSAEPYEQQANAETLMIDATCAPSNIRFPQDFSLLNESRENWEGLFAGSVRITENTFQGHTAGKPGRTTLDWQNADAKIQRRSGRSSVSSLAM